MSVQDAQSQQITKTPRIHTGESLSIRQGSNGDLLLCKAESPPGQQPGIGEQKVVTIMVLTGDPTLPTHPIHALRQAIGAYLETQSRGKILGPKWADPVTSPTPSRAITNVNDAGFDMPPKGR